jgi:uncharacterized protein YehS (DUF1456 family)
MTLYGDFCMTNNDILRRIRYVFDFDDSKMMALFAQEDQSATRAEVSAWLKRDDEPDFLELNDRQLALFLNGLIDDRRGKKEGARPEPESVLTNNIILRKLKIALNFKDDNVLEMLNLANMKLSKHELSAFFRKADHKHYRECQSQVLRNFLKGLQLTYRGDE